MTTALIPFSDMQQMAGAIAKSNLFGMKTPDQVLALMLIAQAEGRHPAIVARDYDIIQGRPAKKSEAMLRDFIDSGGSVKWARYDDEGAEATFSHPQGGTLTISWDAARAKKAGLSGKDNYAKYGRQMYGSRVISEGVRKVYPAATSGMYEPGEVRQIVKDDKKEPKDMGAAEVIDSDGVITNPAPSHSSPPLEGTAPLSPPAAAAGPFETRDATLTRLCKAAGHNKLDMLATCGVSHADELSEEDYDSAIRMLNRKIAKALAAKGEATADAMQP